MAAGITPDWQTGLGHDQAKYGISFFRVLKPIDQLFYHIGSSGETAWSDEIDLCPDRIYIKIAGLTPADLFPNLQMELTGA